MTVGAGKPFRKRSDVVVEQIKSWIVSEKMQPGVRLPTESELISLLGMSKGTVREALKALEVQGLINTRTGPGGGSRLTSVSHDAASQNLRNYFYFSHLAYQHIYDIRVILEPMLAKEVAGRLTPDDLAELRNVIANTEFAATSNEDRLAQRLAEFEFHNILARASANSFLGFLCRFINDLLADLLVYKNEDKRFEQTFAESNACFHHQLLAAFENRDADAAATTMTDHMNDAYSRLSKLAISTQLGNLLKASSGNDYRPFKGARMKTNAKKLPKSASRARILIKKPEVTR